MVKIAHLLLVEKGMPHLDPSISHAKTLVLADLAFSPSSDKLESSSSPGHGHFLYLLQGSSLFYGCQLLIGSPSLPRCNQSGQSGCRVYHLDFAMFVYWTICEDQGGLSILNCLRLQTLEI